ncbi:hypothetical protein DAQ1742_02864 [Dickeya aquatica]|uniref:Uncharacterized protein n=1 Tax=Dickeya aquatica TaxID=1401087 RepID=A0A375AC76_9GAMM|nr:hypothetical protein DAQ1742_02864 [Dickeya aquatica]
MEDKVISKSDITYGPTTQSVWNLLLSNHVSIKSYFFMMSYDNIKTFNTLLKTGKSSAVTEIWRHCFQMSSSSVYGVLM